MVFLVGKLDTNHNCILHMMTLHTRLVPPPCNKLIVLSVPVSIHEFLWSYFNNKLIIYWQGATKGRLLFLLSVLDWELSELHWNPSLTGKPTNIQEVDVVCFPFYHSIQAEIWPPKLSSKPLWMCRNSNNYNWN